MPNNVINLGPVSDHTYILWNINSIYCPNHPRRASMAGACRYCLAVSRLQRLQWHGRSLVRRTRSSGEDDSAPTAVAGAPAPAAEAASGGRPPQASAPAAACRSPLVSGPTREALSQATPGSLRPTMKASGNRYHQPSAVVGAGQLLLLLCCCLVFEIFGDSARSVSHGRLGPVNHLKPPLRRQLWRNRNSLSRHGFPE